MQDAERVTNVNDGGRVDWGIASPIIWTSAIGALLVLLTMLVFSLVCADAQEGLCGGLWRSPPWVVLCLLLVAPGLLLTWYWRMAARRADLAQARAHSQEQVRVMDNELRLAEAELKLTEEELRLRDTELRLAVAEAKNTENYTRVVEQGQLPESFSRSVALLGNDKVEARLGAIYALERISRESERYHWIVVETLAAFVRQNAPLPLLKENTQKRRVDRVPDDLQAALTVLGRRRRDTEEERRESVDISQTNLRRARLTGADFERADLKRAILIRAELEGARLAGANLSYAELYGDIRDSELEAAQRFDPAWIGANLSRADLRGTRFPYADLRGAKLREALAHTLPVGNADVGADFFEADLTWADLAKADLRGASMVGAKLRRTDLSQADLGGVNFSKANLTEANFNRANLSEAIFAKADLRGAKLASAIGLIAKQLETAASLEGTELPEALRQELQRRRPAAEPKKPS